MWFCSFMQLTYSFILVDSWVSFFLGLGYLFLYMIRSVLCLEMPAAVRVLNIHNMYSRIPLPNEQRSLDKSGLANKCLFLRHPIK